MSHRNKTAATKPDERGHPVVRDAIDKGHVVSGEPYAVNGFAGHRAANEGRRVIRVAGEHLGVSVAAWVTDAGGNQCYRSCQDPDAPHGVQFRLFTKQSGRQHVARETGGDPGKLKYNPFVKAERRILDDHGRRIS
jgi:hypothetical protein